MKNTLCWYCSNACGNCPWSNGSFTPVDGWEAEATIIKDYNYIMNSYLVKNCPLFKQDTIIYISVKEVSKLLGISKTNCFRYSKQHLIKLLKLKGYNFNFNITDGIGRNKYYIRKSDDMNSKLVYYVYSKLNKNQFVINNKDDLIQEGFMALTRAEKTFDCSKNINFNTYAITCIKNAMNNYIRQSKKFNHNISIHEQLSEDLELGETIDSNYNLENDALNKVLITHLLKSKSLNETEINIIKSFLQGQSKVKIKQEFNINDAYLYRFFKKLKVIINDFTRK